MHRREFNSICLPVLGSLLALAQGQAQALSLADLSNKDVARGLKTALERGAQSAVSLLGKPGGFLGNEKVRIPLPKALNDGAQLLRTFGQGQRLDELITAMNRAAEAAVPLARDLLVNAVRSMNVDDAKKILNGGDTAATRFFAEKTRAPLGQKFLPVVTQATERVGLADKYNQIAGKAADLADAQGRGQHPAVCHWQNAGWPVSHDWRRGTENPPRPLGHWQRPAGQGLWRIEVILGQ